MKPVQKGVKGEFFSTTEDFYIEVRISEDTVADDKA